MADSVSVQNLIDDAVYNLLPYEPPIRDPGDVRVIGGNGEAIDFKGFAVLPVTRLDSHMARVHNCAQFSIRGVDWSKSPGFSFLFASVS